MLGVHEVIETQFKKLQLQTNKSTVPAQHPDEGKRNTLGGKLQDHGVKGLK